MSSNYNNYEQILCEWLANFVDTDEEGNPLIFRNTAPTLEEIEAFGSKVYCVFTVFEGDFGRQTAQPISLFSYGSQQRVFDKKELLSQALLNNAVVIHGRNIIVKFTSGNPFVQDRVDADENIKGYYVNILSTVYKL